MSKVKRILSVIMAMVMVLAMSIPTFAATKNTATITVDNAEKATLTYAQVIEPDPTKETGWMFVNDEVAQAYMDAFNVTTAQDAIRALIADNNAEAKGLAQANAANHVTFETMANPQTVTKAGIYLIKATETGYTYNIMAAYIGFAEVTKDGETFDYPSLEDARLGAKKTPTTVNKTVADDDNVTTTGAHLTYTVTANVPYIAPTDKNKTFWVYDELTGAKYINLTSATIKLVDEDVTATYPITFDEENNKFSVNLSGMINNGNTNAGKTVTITYEVEVTAENDTITNKATAGHEDGNEYGSKTTTTYEGNITLTKYGESESVKLADAGFEVRKDSKNSVALKFRDLGNNVYVYDPAGTVTEVKTGANGTLTVKGLDVGTYYFKEITAPKGYTINATDSKAVLAVDEESGVASAVLTKTTTMTDTKMSSLPSTGGIGTTIFTIGGCAIMIVAAGLFFATRRKTQK